MREIGCIAKIHGTTAAPATLVFTTADYERAESDELLTSFLDKLFQSHIVLFIGYGLRDRYIIDRLVEARRLRPLTGVGPHFVIALDKMEVPVGVRAIRYRAAPHADHRTALQVLEELVAGPRVRLGNEGLAPGSARSFASVHVVADLLPPGKYTTSQRLTIQGEDVNDTKSVVIGSGLIDAEREDRVSTAAFDILVGLVAFDQIALSLKQIPLLHRLLGSAGFWELVHDGAVLPYHETAEVGVIESESRPKSGELRDFTVFEHDRSPYDVQRALTRMLPAAPGKEAAAAAEIALLAALVVRVDPWPTATFSETTRGLLVRPSLRDLLGISQLIPRDTIPKWYRFPVLRLARIMQVARVCEILRSPSVQFASGNQVIAGVVFGAVTTNTLLGPAVSYITRGRYDLQGAEAMFANPQRVSGLVSFRRSPEAQALRREVLRALSVDAGADAVGAINGGLSAALGVETLQAARDRFSQVGVGTVGAAIPAIWTESRYDQRALSLWRQRSLGELELECQALRLGRDDPCPCGSQERVRECCQRALRGERH
jgi:hypothetical protein